MRFYTNQVYQEKIVVYLIYVSYMTINKKFFFCI